jgi:predicted SAM-dependent methyltransferase
VRNLGRLLAQTKGFLRQCRHEPRWYGQRRALRSLSETQAKKIIIGSSGTSLKGWTATDREVVDLLREDTWTTYFERDSLTAILAEHVWEHLSADEAIQAARTCHRFLKPGGYLRVAVPDGLHPNSSYIEAVRPGGSGPGAHDHKVIYNHVTLQDLFSNVGFDVRLYEFFDKQGQFHFSDWDPADGMVWRSKRFDERNSNGQLTYTSIILDAIKPGG